MRITFYKYLYNHNNVNKGSLLSGGRTVTSEKMTGDQKIDTPTLIISGTGTNGLIDYNYCYIHEWTRYYFVTGRTWLSDNMFQISLQEDYLFSARDLIYRQYGICRYSGLGDTNIPDPRIKFDPDPIIESYEVSPVSPTVISTWYVLKFTSENPFTSQTQGRCTTNVAIMNAEAYRAFTLEYKALSEQSRVIIGRCLQTVNRVRYINPDESSLGGNQYGIRFQSPFASEQGVSTATVAWSMVEYPAARCYIITGPDEVRYLRPVVMRVDESGGGPIKVFNELGLFYELEAQYYIRLPDLQPIEIKPVTLGFSTAFSIVLSIAYEPFSENLVITFRKYQNGNYDTRIAYAPIVQRCQTSVAFLTDNALNLYDQATTANQIGLASGIFGGTVSSLGALIQGNVVGAVPGLFGIASAGNNYEMRQRQLDIADFMATGMTGSVSGSVTWTPDVFTAAGFCWVIKQDPIAAGAIWDDFGKPDGHYRKLETLAGTGYAEIELPTGLSYNTESFTAGELDIIRSKLSTGVIFNE